MTVHPSAHRHPAAAARAAALAEAVLHPAGRAVVETGAGDLTLEARVVPWDVPARVTDDGRRFYTESWGRGSLIPDDRVVIFDHHIPGQLHRDGRQPIGRAAAFRDEADGLWCTLTLANTARGRDIYELARTLGSVDLSLETLVDTPTTDTVARSSSAPAPLTGIAIILPPGHGAYPGALAVAARSDPGDTDPDPPAPTPPAPAPTPDGDPGGRAAIADAVRAEMARFRDGRGAPTRAARHAFTEFASMDALIAAARSSAAGADLSAQFTAAYHQHRQIETAARTAAGRAWVDQVTADNPGLMPPSWLTQVFGIIDEGRPAITSLGGPRDPGDSGLDVYWPFYDGDLRAIVTQQAAEKTEINSVKVSFKRGQATLLTYAGGSDVSYQLQRRSTPGYMALYDRVLQLAYGIRTEIAFATVIAAVATPPVDWDMGAADPTGALLRGALFAASSRVKRATGRPATVVLAATDVFIALGGSAWAIPPAYGTQNVSGVAQASTLRINVSGLEVVEVPDFPAGEMVVTNDLAASWFEEGPFLVTAEDVAKLGTDVAIWGMGTPGVFTPAGVVPIHTAAGPPAAARRGSTADK